MKDFGVHILLNAKVLFLCLVLCGCSATKDEKTLEELLSEQDEIGEFERCGEQGQCRCMYDPVKAGFSPSTGISIIRVCPSGLSNEHVVEGLGSYDRLISRCRTRNRMRHGECEAYNWKGDIAAEATFVNGCIDGTEHTFHVNGGTEWIRHYDNGTPVGRWERHRPDGTLDGFQVYEGGYLRSVGLLKEGKGFEVTPVDSQMPAALGCEGPAF